MYDNFDDVTSTWYPVMVTHIYAGSYNIVIDKDAGTAFAISGNEIRIKANIYRQYNEGCQTFTFEDDRNI